MSRVLLQLTCIIIIDFRLTILMIKKNINLLVLFKKIVLTKIVFVFNRQNHSLTKDRVVGFKTILTF